jgi:hypothetical protein
MLQYRRISVDLQSSSHVMSINASEYIKLYYSSFLLRISWHLQNEFIWCFQATAKNVSSDITTVTFLFISTIEIMWYYEDISVETGFFKYLTSKQGKA